MSHYEYVSDKEKKFLETKYKLNDLIKNYLYNSKSIEKYEDKINSIKLDNTKLFSILYTINLVDNIRKLLLLNLFISNKEAANAKSGLQFWNDSITIHTIC